MTRSEQLQLLTQTGHGTELGRLLRLFWHPVALSREVAKGAAIPMRILGEDLTLYRGDSGQPYLVGGHCAHRRTVLHTGWVQGEQIRCMYHGWKYDGGGACVERPAEGADAIPKSCRIPGYPAREYCGLVFAYLGEGAAPEFDLPRKDVLEKPGMLIEPTRETWDTNFFQQIENSLDAVHVSFVHRALKVADFGNAVTDAMPELSYVETEAGIEQTAVRAKDNVRKSNWTFPNNNHVRVPGLEKGDPWIDFVIWMTPNDDQSSTRFTLYAMADENPAASARFRDYFSKYGSYNAAEHFDDLFHWKKAPPAEDFLAGLISAQDYLAQRGQGRIADREHEILGRSDLGVVTLRRIFWRELKLLREGKPAKQWTKRAQTPELPTQPGLIRKNAIGGGQ